MPVSRAEGAQLGDLGLQRAAPGIHASWPAGELRSSRGAKNVAGATEREDGFGGMFWNVLESGEVTR